MKIIQKMLKGRMFILLFTTMALSLAQPAETVGQCTSGFVYSMSGSPYAIQFYDSSLSSPGMTWQWDFGDGSSSTLQNPLHNYSTQFQRYYLVCLTVTWPSGCTAVSCDSVWAGQQQVFCSAGFTVAQTPGTTLYTFTNTSTGAAPLSYNWSFGDGTSSTSGSPVHSYSAPGTYNVCLVITASNGCTDTYCATVTVQGGGGTGCQAGFTAQVSGNSVTFTNSSSPSGVVSTWSFGDGATSTVGGTGQVSHIYQMTGRFYSVCLTISDSTCTDTYCDSVYIGSTLNCQANFAASPVAGTSNVNFTNQSTAGSQIVSWLWSFGDSTTSSSANPSHAYAAAGTYYVCLTITDANGCTDTYCQFVTAGGASGCQANFSVQVSPGGAATFISNSTPSNAINVWDFGDGTVQTVVGQTAVTHTYAQQGYYVACLTVQDSLSGCSDTQCDTVLVNIQAGCQANFSFYVDSLNPVTVTFVDQSTTNPVSWFWDFGDGTTSTLQNPQHTYAVEADYTVCLTMTGGGCTDTYCTTVRAANYCAPYINAAPDSSNPASVTMTFFAYSLCGNPSDIAWDFGDGTIDTSGNQNPTHTYATPGWFDVCACVVINTDTFCFCDSVFAQRLASGIDDLNRPQNLSVYPNPVNSVSQIDYTLPVSGLLVAEVYDLLGNKVSVIANEKQQAGAHSLTFRAEQLPAGTYVLRISIDGLSASKRIILVP